MQKGDTYFSKTVRLLRKKYGLSQEEFGKRIGVGKSTVSNYESGISTPSSHTLRNMAYEFKVAPSYFLDDPNEFSKKELQTFYGTDVPVIDNTNTEAFMLPEIPEGTPIITLPPQSISSNADYIGTSVCDNSMNLADIRVNDFIVIDRNKPLCDGAIVAVINKDRLTLRRYHESAYGKYVQAESTKLPSSLSKTTLPDDDLYIVGTVVKIISDARHK